MKRILLISACLISWALATTVNALPVELADESAIQAPEQRGFSQRITGTATLTDGESIDVNMLLGFAESSRGWYFQAGPDVVFRETPPQAYFLNFTLDGNGNAYVLDFSDQPLKHFQVQLDDYEIELMQAKGADIQYGMRLRIDNRQFLFDSRHPRVRLELSEQGVVGVVAEHTMRDLSIRRAQ